VEKNILELDRPQMTIWRMRIAYWNLRLKTHTHTPTEYVILLFHYNNSYTNAPQRYVIRKLPGLFILYIFWHAYVLGGAYFVWPWKSRAPCRDIVTSQRGHWPLLIRVSGITWRGSKLLEVSRNVNFFTRYVCTCVGAGSGMGGGIRKIYCICIVVMRIDYIF
jgi:hypothetical protein